MIPAPGGAGGCAGRRGEGRVRGEPVAEGGNGTRAGAAGGVRAVEEKKKADEDRDVRQVRQGLVGPPREVPQTVKAGDEAERPQGADGPGRRTAAERGRA